MFQTTQQNKLSRRQEGSVPLGATQWECACAHLRRCRRTRSGDGESWYDGWSCFKQMRDKREPPLVLTEGRRPMRCRLTPAVRAHTLEASPDKLACMAAAAPAPWTRRGSGALDLPEGSALKEGSICRARTWQSSATSARQTRAACDARLGTARNYRGCRAIRLTRLRCQQCFCAHLDGAVL